MLITIATVIAGIILALNGYVVKPIAAVNAAIGRISLGDLSHTLPVNSKDEIGELSNNFNEMTRQLAATHRHLEKASQAANEGRAQLESSINGLRQGFILTDAKSKVVMANAAATQIVQSDPRSKTSATATLKLAELSELLPPEADLAKQVTHTMETRESTKLANLPLGGHFLNVYLSAVVNENTAIGCVVLLEDVTEERILQRSRDEFFSIASHELRTPLTAIRGNTSLIQQYFPEAMKDDSMAEMINDIHESSVRLIEIVNDFLDVSRLEQNKVKFDMSAFPVEKVVEKVIYEMAGMSRDKGVKLNFDQNTLGKIPMVYGDINRVKQVIYNLVGNAMKFTEKGSITINCLVQKDHLKVCVSDTGPGIPAESQQILFHKFQQATNSILTRDNTRGTGLGLYISKLLLEHMNGAIALEHSEVGKGSTFSFTVPIATKEQIEWSKAQASQIQKAQAAMPVAPSDTAKASPKVNKDV